MNHTSQVSKQTRNNWWVDIFLLSSTIVAGLSGIYFLFLPTGGYKGGTNPFYNIQIIFTRTTWEDLHDWAGVVMIVVAALHIPLHWNWFVNMTKRMVKMVRGKSEKMSARGQFNLYVNLTVALSFLLTGLTGLYFFLVPGASHGSGQVDPMWLFTRTTWDLIHTWSSVIMISAATLHFAIHWKWVTKVTNKIFGRTTLRQPSQSNHTPSTPILVEVRHD